MSRALWLIGFRAAGKSTLGKALAERLGWRFLDLDDLLEAREGCSLLELVDREGLAYFRAREEIILREVSALAAEGLVIATGGGFVDEPGSRAVVEASPWPKVWIDPPPEWLWARLSNSPGRQIIGYLTDRATMNSLLEKRRPYYENIATYRLESQDISECLAALQRFVLGGN